MKGLLSFLGVLITIGILVFIGININTFVKNNKNHTSGDSINIVDKIENFFEEVIEEKNEKTNEKAKEKVENEVTYSSKDEAVIENLSTTLDEIKKSEVTENFKENSKKVFIDLVDFLFYGGKIKGYTFEELTDAGKEKVLKLANEIDEAIETKCPNYKDTISEKATNAFKSASSLIKKGSSNLNDFLKEKLSEEHYNAIIDSKDDLVKYSEQAISYIATNGSKLLTEAKDKLSEWYNKYKNN